MVGILKRMGVLTDDRFYYFYKLTLNSTADILYHGEKQ